MSDNTIREHPLPFRLDELHDATTLDPWLARFADRTADEIAEILRAEWSAIRSPAVASFRDAVLTFQPCSLCYAEDKELRGWWLKMQRPEVRSRLLKMYGPEALAESGAEIRSWWLKTFGPEALAAVEGGKDEAFLHAPPEREVLAGSLARFSLSEQDAMVMMEFYYHFYQFAFSLFHHMFFTAPPWDDCLFEDRGWYEDVSDHPDHFDPRGEWSQAFLIYCTSTGDDMLMKPNGELAWFLAAEQRIAPLGISFSCFLEQCATCCRTSGPLDYYDYWIDRCGGGQE